MAREAGTGTWGHCSISGEGAPSKLPKPPSSSGEAERGTSPASSSANWPLLRAGGGGRCTRPPEIALPRRYLPSSKWRFPPACIGKGDGAQNSLRPLPWFGGTRQRSSEIVAGLPELIPARRSDARLAAAQQSSLARAESAPRLLPGLCQSEPRPRGPASTMATRHVVPMATGLLPFSAAALRPPGATPRVERGEGGSGPLSACRGPLAAEIALRGGGGQEDSPTETET